MRFLLVFLAIVSGCKIRNEGSSGTKDYLVPSSLDDPGSFTLIYKPENIASLCIADCKKDKESTRNTLSCKITSELSVSAIPNILPARQRIIENAARGLHKLSSLTEGERQGIEEIIKLATPASECLKTDKTDIAPVDERQSVSLGLSQKGENSQIPLYTPEEAERLGIKRTFACDYVYHRDDLLAILSADKDWSFSSLNSIESACQSAKSNCEEYAGSAGLKKFCKKNWSGEFFGPYPSPPAPINVPSKSYLFPDGSSRNSWADQWGNSIGYSGVFSDENMPKYHCTLGYYEMSAGTLANAKRAVKQRCEQGRHAAHDAVCSDAVCCERRLDPHRKKDDILYRCEALGAAMTDPYQGSAREYLYWKCPDLGPGALCRDSITCTKL